MKLAVIVLLAVLSLPSAVAGEYPSSPAAPAVYVATQKCAWKSSACPVLWNEAEAGGYQPGRLQDATLVLSQSLALIGGQRVIIAGKAGYGLMDGAYQDGTGNAVVLVVHAIEVVYPDGTRLLLEGSVAGENLVGPRHYMLLPLHGTFLAALPGDYRIEVRAYSASSQFPAGGPLVMAMGVGSFGPFGQMITSVYDGALAYNQSVGEVRR